MCWLADIRRDLAFFYESYDHKNNTVKSHSIIGFEKLHNIISYI
jgi:hypothetical protein